jgi:ABC-2 type transport system ATP-binding protein
MSQTKPILELNHLKKSYGATDALHDVSLTFKDTGIYGLFGRNGAGKTTLLDIVAARIFADSGHVTCYGKDISKHPGIVADNLCYMPEKHYFPVNLKIKTLLSFARQSFANYSVETEERLCQVFNLDTNKKYKALSRGYQSIFRIVLGLASNAPITIFDEPVLGLDAVARDRFYQQLIEEFAENPRLFIVSTHLIEESADLFNEAIIINQGIVVKQGSVDAMLSNYYYVSGQIDRVNDFIENRTVLNSRIVNTLKTIVVEGDLEATHPIPGLRFSPLTIQNLFIHLTSNEHHWE